MHNPIRKYDIDRRILFYIFFGIAMLGVCIYIKELWYGVLGIVDVLKPVLTGLLLAFVLNVLMRFLETRFFDKLARKHPAFAKVERPVSLV